MFLRVGRNGSDTGGCDAPAAGPERDQPRFRAGAARDALERDDVADTIEVNGSSDEVDRFARLWDAMAEEDEDAGQLLNQLSQRPLVIHAERV